MTSLEEVIEAACQAFAEAEDEWQFSDTAGEDDLKAEFRFIADAVRAWAKENAAFFYEDSTEPGEPMTDRVAVPLDKFGGGLDEGLAEAARGEVKDLDWSIFPEGDDE